jgi:hypothetical protein
MAAAGHRIGRIVFDIDVPEPGALGGVEAMVRAQFDAVIAPALEMALDRVDRPDELVRFGCVEIDLGVLDPAETGASTLGHLIMSRLAGALTTNGSIEAANAGFARDDAAEFVAFLETGNLPWTEPGKVLDALAATLISLDANGMTRLAMRLRTVLIQRRSVDRLVHQMPATFVRRLLRALLPESMSTPVAFAFGPDRPAAMGALAPADLVTALSDVIRRVAIGTDPPELGEVVALYAALDGRAPRVPVQSPVAHQSRHTPVLLDAPSLPDLAPDATRLPTSPPVVSLQVHAAGAVLLHPFLATFFGRLGLLDESDRFRDDDARMRAVLLAHHVATGAHEAPEPETVLFKLLCGMALSDPLPRRIGVTDQEREEADQLLVNVIFHWKRLGRTSPAGLREGFLSRPGQLRARGDQWRLIVEPRGVDVLLQELPWTLSHVKTPFMRSILVVDWR